MISEQLENSELDGLIRNALSSVDDLSIPPGLSEKIIRKLEKKILLRELVLELGLKIVLVTGSLAVLAGVFILLNGTGVLTSLLSKLIDNWRIITSLLLLVIITIIIDQVGLKFYNTFNRKAGLKIL